MTPVLIVVAVCSWNSPGADPYRGQPAAAVDSYADIPAETRAKLRDRVEARRYDDVAEITRDGVRGVSSYTGLRQMHFGASKVCGTVDRSGWSSDMRERGLVYCEDGHCLIVPTVCRNVSRVDRVVTPPVALDHPPIDDLPSGGTVGYAPLALDPVARPLGLPEQRHVAPWPVFVPSMGRGDPPAGPIPAVPELKTLALMALGVVVVVVKCFCLNRKGLQ